MKYANVLWRKELNERGIRYKQINWVHDEWVTEVPGSKEIAETVGLIQSEAIRMVGEIFGLRCPMGGEYKVGKTWLDVH
jgi:DNA polymerase-1